MPSISLSRTAPFAILGCILSAYALYVEHKVANKPEEEEFSAFCDIELIGASCSNVFQLPEGRMLTYFNIVPKGSILDVPNAALGLLFYSYWLFLMPTLPNVLTVIVSSMAMASSVFLAIKLVMLNELCILCWSTHAINSRIFWSVMANLVLGGNNNNSSSNKKKIKTIKRV
ncbi:hypothetical protein FRACYDRAFT_267199 [Fragilariopsis cylindrus CCMP1102]|uniref:vitamin-K-epoxide reductase (warfarin-sensitive) n=1 Tax=Fragilariopsis cylindrus CCMP1102 TaxID=635003 RepID=A0A1E7FVQ0_9STRA|nr:hypothetical protein FRACYDRAFT_267199 [Fragilariopsis cylindrus CCMP1102]|eukprot:OEU22238.1 hypothetical protein FRACYDRAFT_267199 [Fragilariopsis cylindrus CCMP1102]